MVTINTKRKNTQSKNVKKSAFTLAEVLITIGIIGVVAAITLPTLMHKIKGKIVQNELKHVHAVLNQAYKLAIAENGDITGWELKTANSAPGALAIYSYFKPYLKIGKDCGTGTGCFYSGTYKALFNDSWAWQPNTYPVYAKVKLLDGTSLAFWGNGNTNCRNTDTYCGAIYFDINGDAPPNKAGVDYFKFQILKDGVVAVKISDSDPYGSHCKYMDTSDTNGVYCADWVMKRGNLDYLKRDISKEAENL
jgi:prepilin-type N-terminal cleavage/methylation domain-containing protein